MSRDENQRYFSAVTIHAISATAIELPQNGERDVFPFTQRMEIVNTTDREVLVSTRQGITYAISPSAAVTRSREPGITIRLQTTVDKYAVTIDVRNQLNDPINQDQHTLLKSISGGKFDTNSRRHHGLEYFVSKAELEANGDILYLNNCDLQLSRRPAFDTPEHPFSTAGNEHHSIIDNDFLNSRSCLGISFKIVDNGAKIGDRYVNFGGTIFHVRPVKDITLPDGLYAVLNGVAENGYRGSQPKAKFHPLDELDKVYGGFYRTVEEARIYGDTFKQMEREREEKAQALRLRELELKNAEHELRAEKHRYSIKLQELELKLTEVKQEAELRKLEYARENDAMSHYEKKLEHSRKLESAKKADTYEDRAQSRKEMAEFAKIALQITAQVILGIALPIIIKTSKT